MGTYASTSDVTARLPGRTFGASTSPSTTDISGWIDTAEARLESALASVGITVPVTATRGIEVLKELAIDYAEGRVRRGLASAGGDADNEDGQDLITRFNDAIASIEGNPAGWSAIVEGGSASDTTRRVRSHTLDHPDGSTVSAGDFDPVFTRAEKF